MTDQPETEPTAPAEAVPELEPERPKRPALTVLTPTDLPGIILLRMIDGSLFSFPAKDLTTALFFAGNKTQSPRIHLSLAANEELKLESQLLKPHHVLRIRRAAEFAKKREQFAERKLLQELSGLSQI